MSLVQNTKVYFEDISHSYWTEDGKELSGVTSLMKRQGLSPNYSDISEEVLRAAAERGSKAHKDIENYCKGLPFDDTPEVRAFAALGLNVVANEYLVSDNEHIASSIDIVGAVKDDPDAYNLIDVKRTSAYHSRPVMWQLSIYAYLFELQNPGKRVATLYGCHYDKNKEVFNLHEMSRIPSDEVKRLLDYDKRGKFFIPKENIDLTEKPKNGELMDFSGVVALLMDIDKMKAEIKEKEAQIQEVKDFFLVKMKESGVTSIENEFLKITKVAESERVSINAKALQEQYPEIYTQIAKVSKVKPTIKLTIRK